MRKPQAPSVSLASARCEWKTRAHDHGPSLHDALLANGFFPDMRAMSAMQDEVFGDPVSVDEANALVQRLSLADGVELWVGEAEGQIVTAGRLEPVPSSDFAGIWGGATRSDWRGRGIYRAVTAARARSAIARGKTLIHSDSTADSRPILERSGFIAVSTTTPYHWLRRADRLLILASLLSPCDSDIRTPALRAPRGGTRPVIRDLRTSERRWVRERSA